MESFDLPQARRKSLADSYLDHVPLSPINYVIVSSSKLEGSPKLASVIFWSEPADSTHHG